MMRAACLVRAGIVALALAAAACGQKGALYLPDKTRAPVPAHAGAAPPPAPTPPPPAAPAPPPGGSGS